MINLNIKIAKNNKFATANLGCFLRLPLTRHNLAYASLLARLQMNASLYFPTMQKQRALFSSLYDLQFEIVPQLFGRQIILSSLANFVEPKQVLDPDYNYEQIIQKLALVIEHPSFARQLIIFSKRQLLAEYQELMASPANFALDRFFKIWYQKEPDYADDFIGSLSEIKTANPQTIANFAASLRAVPMAVFGQAQEPALLQQLVKMQFKQAGLLKVFAPKAVDIAAPNLRISRSEEQQNGQAQFLLGYAYQHQLSRQEQVTATVIAEYLAGDQSSKLFRQIREQIGAAYAVEANSFAHNSLFLINMGIDPQQIGSARAIVQAELKKIATGQVDLSLLRKAKRALTNAYLLRQDQSEYQLMQLLRQQLLPGFADFDQLKAIKGVTSAKMASLVKKMDLNESYVLK